MNQSSENISFSTTNIIKFFGPIKTLLLYMTSFTYMDR